MLQSAVPPPMQIVSGSGATETCDNNNRSFQALQQTNAVVFLGEEKFEYLDVSMSILFV